MSTKVFIKKLYDENNNIDDRPIEITIGESSRNLSNLEAEKIEGEILLTELSEALKNMINEKSPGLGGFTVELIIYLFIFLDRYKKFYFKIIKSWISYGITICNTKNRVLSHVYRNQINLGIF